MDRDSQRAPPPSRHYQHDLETCQKYLFSGPHPAASDSGAGRGASGDREGALTGFQEQMVPISVGSVTPCWKLEIGHGGSVGSIDVVRSSESGLSSPSPLLNCLPQPRTGTSQSFLFSQALQKILCILKFKNH